MSGGTYTGYGTQGRAEWLDVDWREHRRWVRVEDRWANVVEMGSGDPVLLVHGLGGSWQNWLENMPALARRWRVVAMDLPGFGESEMPAEDISISGYGQWMCSLMDSLGIERAAFVGNSMGGFISAECAIAFPERVDRLVLVSAAGITAEKQRNDHVMAGMYRTERISAFLSGHVAARADVFVRRPRMREALMRLVVRHPRELSAALAAEQVRGAGKPGFLPALDALTSYPIRDRLDRISCGTLVVWGADDHLVPLRDASVFEEVIPDARKVIFDDTGHVPMLERPARFNRLIEDFLSEAPGERVDEVSEAAGPVSREEAETVREAEEKAVGAES